MARGPTRRVQDLMDSGLFADDTMTAACYEADLLAHPYVGLNTCALLRSPAPVVNANMLRCKGNSRPGFRIDPGGPGAPDPRLGAAAWLEPATNRPSPVVGHLPGWGGR